MIIVIDGNIGSGKSTQVEKLKEDFSVHREPLEEWGNLLKWFYEDPSRWALAFQFKVLKCFNQVPDDKSETIVVERYPESCRCVFWKVLCDQGKVTQEEQDIYKDYYHTFNPDVIIYLRCPPEKSIERSRDRGQDGDDVIQLDYVTQLHDLYETMYQEKDAHILDATKTPEEIYKEIKCIINNKRNVDV